MKRNLGCDAVYCGGNLPDFRRNQLSPFSGYLMKITGFSETLLNFYHTPRRRHLIYIYILIIEEYRAIMDRLCGLVVRVSGYRYRGPGFDPRRYQIF